MLFVYEVLRSSLKLHENNLDVIEKLKFILPRNPVSGEAEICSLRIIYLNAHLYISNRNKPQGVIIPIAIVKYHLFLFS